MRSRSAVIDPRIRAAEYELGGSYGQRMGRLLDGIYDACPKRDVSRAWGRLPEAHRALFVIYFATAEIDNGGLHQYFSNSTGDWAALLPGAARLFGAEPYADIFDRAIACFDPHALSDRDYRNGRLDELDDADPLDRLTTEYHELEDRDAPIYAAIERYIHARPAAFFTG
ncbi:MAG: hypothetical protein QOJ82_2407 [Solirubrobacteraceae bacterium]|nr:hypothetical protein [Solirubrobacteraceae bacterium]